MAPAIDTQFTEYLEHYKKLISKVARIYCFSDFDRKDLIQDIILQLWKSFSKYDDSFALSTWTYRIALNVSISHFRKSSSRSETHEAFHKQLQYLTIEEDIIDENLALLYSFIELLKPIDKAIMVLYMEGCKNKEIADVTGMSLSNISTKKLRIKEELKEHFKKLNK